MAGSSCSPPSSQPRKPLPSPFILALDVIIFFISVFMKPFEWGVSIWKMKLSVRGESF